MGCASGVVKYLVFLFNLVFALAGLAMLIVGIISLIDIEDLSKLTESNTYSTSSIFLIVVGAIMFVISFFGCCGAIRENPCMLTTYSVILLILFVVQIALGVFAFLQLKDNAEIKQEYYKALSEAYLKYRTDETTREEIDSMQQAVKCCGYNGPTDFLLALPESCCEGNNGLCTIFSDKYFKEPCKEKLYETLKKIVHVMGYVAIGLCVTELVAAIFSFCLSSSIRNEHRRNNYV